MRVVYIRFWLELSFPFSNGVSPSVGFAPPGPEVAAGSVGRTIPVSVATGIAPVSVAAESTPVFAGVADPIVQPPTASEVRRTMGHFLRVTPQAFAGALAQDLLRD